MFQFLRKPSQIALKQEMLDEAERMLTLYEKQADICNAMADAYRRTALRLRAELAEMDSKRGRDA